MIIASHTARAALFAAIMAAATHAKAADESNVPALDWTGFYVGGHVGAGRAEMNGLFDASAIAVSGDNEDSAFADFLELEDSIAGIHVGYNVAYGRFVFGIEADWSRFNPSDRVFDAEVDGPGGGTPDSLATTDNIEAEIHWIASLRGRFGIASAQSFLYATVGIAWLDADYRANDDDGAAPGLVISGETDLNAVGYVVGGGLEHAVARNLAIRLEGLYYKFDERRDTSTLNNDASVGDFAEIQDVVVGRLGVSYRFDRSPTGTEAGAGHRPVIWRGIYVGGHAGFANTDFDSVFDSGEILNNSPPLYEDAVEGRFFDLNGEVGGVQAGINFNIGRFVYGAEFDWTNLDKSDLLFDPDGSSATGNRFNDNAEVSLDWIASARARVGVTSARTLFFATAGIAWIEGDYTARNRNFGNVNEGTTDIRETGFVVGGGMEHALTDNILIRFEGLHYEFDDRQSTSTLTTDSDPGDFAEINDITVFRVGASYKFQVGSN